LLTTATGFAVYFVKNRIGFKYRVNKANASLEAFAFFMQDIICPLTYNLPLDQNHLFNVENKMNLVELSNRVAIIALSSLFSTPLIAQDVDQLDVTQTIEKWGQLVFCQRIYKSPSVKPRLYDFDIESCDKAGLLVADVIAKYSAQDQKKIKNLAEQHAVRLSYNTSDPYQAVPACREYCSKLVQIKEKRDD
jgi:hypothetical protein